MCFLDNIRSLRRKRFRALVREYGGLVDDGLLLRMVGCEAELNDGLTLWRVGAAVPLAGFTVQANNVPRVEGHDYGRCRGDAVAQTLRNASKAQTTKVGIQIYPPATTLACYWKGIRVRARIK